MSWFCGPSKLEMVEVDNDRLKSENRRLSLAESVVLRDLADARAATSKLRARNHRLREERQRLRALLEEHNIPWVHSGVEPSTST
jgi:ABC-type phosphate transport system auxiliary subunit